MSDYDTDIVGWSQRQAKALRSRGASNTIDWDNVAEEIESVGRSETDAVASLLTNVVGHKLKLLGWPDNESANHWRGEIRGWLVQAVKKYRASMHIKVEDIFEDAMLRIEVAMLDLPPPGVALPQACPWTLEELLAEGASLRRGGPP